MRLKAATLLMFALLACSASVVSSAWAKGALDNQSSSNDQIDNDEYEVWSALIDELYAQDGVKLIVITEPTCCDTLNVHSRTDLQVRLGPVSSEAVEDYAERNRQSLAFEKKFKLKTRYRIVPYAEIEKLFDGSDLDTGWKTFYTKYPASGGYITLSRVGFNKAKDEAVVSVGWMAAPLRGQGNYVLLTRQNGSWKVSKKVGTWIV